MKVNEVCKQLNGCAIGGFRLRFSSLLIHTRTPGERDWMRIHGTRNDPDVPNDNDGDFIEVLNDIFKKNTFSDWHWVKSEWQQDGPDHISIKITFVEK